MGEVHGGKAFPMLVPPWNRIDAALLPHLRNLGYRALSGFGVARPQASVPVVNTHIDLIDWRGMRGCRDHAVLIAGLVDHIGRARLTGEPVGILTHHLVHDAGVWAFLESLFRLTCGYDCCAWLTANDSAFAAV